MSTSLALVKKSRVILKVGIVNSISIVCVGVSSTQVLSRACYRGRGLLIISSLRS